MKKVFISVLAVTVILAVAVSCGGRRKAAKGELSGELSLSGAFALYPLAVKWAEEFQKIHPGVRIDISAGGAGKGMTDVLAGVVDLGMVSREVYPPEAAKGAVPFAVAKDAVVATVNTGNPALADLMKRGLSRGVASGLWISEEYRTWGQVAGTADNSPVHLYTRSDACGAAETWALWMDRKQEDLAGTAVFGDPGVAQAVQRDRLGIGFNNLSYTYDENTRLPNPGMLVFPIDVDGNGQIDPEESFYETKDRIIEAIAAGKYPSPPARDLYLVTAGIPENPALVAFLRFILTDGQQYNVPAGYISLSEEKLQRGLDLIGKQ
ncbi:MAG: PstS family phosphate ABC transporter substrate-binding protein [Bacteroidales bacterium]|jgi:phosphate transport system substrate-binding protein|nr:PstS family phosphate ABC transporter substrate-binding protein [Bacteroidales bacterium]